MSGHVTGNYRKVGGCGRGAGTRSPCGVEMEESKDREFESGVCGFETWSSQTNYFKIDTCHFLAKCSALIG